MFNSNEINLADLINLKHLQKLQDKLSDLTNSFVVTVDHNTQLTNPSGTKRSASTNFTIPIIVNDTHIASILGGQENIKYQEDKRELEISSDENAKEIKSFISFIASLISEIANRNFDLLKRMQREKLTEEIIKKVRSTLDKDEIKKYFVEILQEYFEADRCIFADFDISTNKFLPFGYEKLKSEEVKSFLNVDLEKRFPEFCKRLRNNKDIIIRDVEKASRLKSVFSYEAINTLKSNNTKSDYGLLVKCQNDIVGVIVLHFINETKILNKDELTFLKVIREHTGTGLCQAELYERTKELAQRENLLRNISETIRNSLDLKTTKQTIVDNIGKTLEIDRCFIAEYDKFSDKFFNIKEEYRSSDEVVSFIDIDINASSPSFISEFKKGKPLIISQAGNKLGDEEIDFNDAKFAVEKETKEKFNITSAIIFPLLYKKDFIGNLVLHSMELQKNIGEDEINFLNLISSQIAIALHQAKMYKEIQLNAERERISRNIVEIMRSTLDKNIIKKLFVKNIGKFFNADRVFMCDFDEENKKLLPVDENSEFLSNKNLKSFICADWSNGAFGSYNNLLKEKRELLIPSVKEYINNNTLNEEQIKMFETSESKSSYSFPIPYQNSLMGYLSIGFVEKTEITDEETNRIRSICTQAGIAMYHANLYMKAQEAMQTRSTVVNKIKNGLEPTVNHIVKDLDHVLNSCHELIELTKDISET